MIPVQYSIYTSCMSRLTPVKSKCIICVTQSKPGQIHQAGYNISLTIPTRSCFTIVRSRGSSCQKYNFVLNDMV